MTWFNRYFKLIFLIVFIIQTTWFIFEYSQKNRYKHIKNYGMFDTKEAKLYVFGSGNIGIVDFKQKTFTKNKIIKPTN